ncbi:unnamed protein product [Clonostachys byssicola]|uniref:FAD-binding domain-containing protein n=1 Tax=Clonostachys byssicola TaxID=160290 RepID=A0A9N9UJN1_9HYPO|nr:unnamed protein product [Clonostachys byssicola]
MPETDVVIVGAGPSGLSLAVALSQLQIKSVVLEKQHDICEDPRAIALAGDASRILSLIGITAREMDQISQPLSGVNFYDSTFTSVPFLQLEHDQDWSEQSLPNASVILQPGLEQLLRDRAYVSEYITLKLDCEVVGIVENPNNVEVTYKEKGTPGTYVIRGQYTVGADGKRGFVRKHFLEDKGIKQETGRYSYEATWVAANLKVTMPTPSSHPHFPLWDLGYEPDELWDLFWPGGFHFCNHPTMPVATGRFGPIEEKYWRFEYELPPNFELPEDAVGHLKEQMEPHLTIPPSGLRGQACQLKTPVRFPWDCVEVLRCGPAHFVQKVVNRWFDGRVILIGDAAHVFPPFGAQGIVSGIRDALGLSWRLSLLVSGNRKIPHKESSSFNKDSLLLTWSRERRQGVDEAARMTAANGTFLQTKSQVLRWAVWCADTVISWIPRLRLSLLRGHFSDRDGVRGVKDGFFLEDQGGGTRTAQIFIQGACDRSVHLSDHVFRNSNAALTLLILHHPETEQEWTAIQQASKRLDLPSNFLAEKAICLSDKTSVSLQLQPESKKIQSSQMLTPATAVEASRAGHKPLPLYDPSTFRKRFQSSAKYALIRSDFIIFSQAKTLEQLEDQISRAWEMVTNS